MKLSTLAGAAILSLAAGLAQATTLALPGYSDTLVGTVPDTTAAFGDLAFGGDGTGFVTGGFGSNIGDIYRMESNGTFNFLANLGLTSLGIAEHDGFLYVSDSSGTIHKVDSTTGVKTIFASGHGYANDIEVVAGLAGASFSLVLGGAGGSATFLHGDTGALQASVATGRLSSIDVALDGTLLGVDYSSSLVNFDSTGVISSTAYGRYDGVAVRQDDGTVFAYDPAGLIDTLAGGINSPFATALVGDGGTYPAVFQFSVDGTRLYYGERVSGSGMVISYIDGFNAYAAAPAVPLPASLPLLLAGFGGLAMFRRKRG